MQLTNHPDLLCYYFKPKQPIPLVIEPHDKIDFSQTIQFIKQNKDLFLNALAKEGALLLRKFPITNDLEKKEILNALGVKLEKKYPFGISPRKGREEAVFNSTEIPGPFPLSAHTEMSYLPFRPSIIAFHCILAPEIYGETPLFDMRTVFNQLSEKAKHCLQYNKVHYWHRYPKTSSILSANIQLTWPSIFQTTDKKIVSNTLDEHGFSHHWERNDTLEYLTKTPAIVTHPITQQRCLNLLVIHPYATYKAFRQLHMRQNFFMHYGLLISTLLFGILKKPATSATLGEQYKLSFSLAKEISDLSWQHASLFSWQTNDLLLVDNISVAHGRMNVVGPRTITVSFGNRYYTE